MIGRLVKVCSDGYTVRADGVDYVCRARGKLRLSSDRLFVGDTVEFENCVINEVKERKNYLIRPRVSNVDLAVVVIAHVPQPDFYLVDKVLIASEKIGIETIIVVNKTEMDKKVLSDVINQYGSVCEIISVSAKDNKGIEVLRQKLKGKTAVLAGQSAVGKTSIINALFSLELKTGELSEKISRGRHTTTYSEIFEKDDVSVVDSPGFAVIEAEADETELLQLYPEYVKLSEKCRFRGCSHTIEPDCEVKLAVDRGQLSKERYQRYVEIYSEIKNRRKKYEKN